MKLMAMAKIWWFDIEEDLKTLKFLSFNTWRKMKTTLQKKYMPSNYYRKLCKQLNNLQQGNLYVAECLPRFDNLMLQSRIIEDPRQTIA